MPKSIFITGGTSGIGLATAKRFKEAGFRVAISGRNIDVLNQYKDEYCVYRAEVTDFENVRDAIFDFAEGGLDIVFANAGIGYVHKSKIPDFNRAREIVDVNINGVLNTFEAATEVFFKQGHGHLVATASIAGLNGLPGVPAYSGSKAAIIKICESLRMDLEESEIHVTCVNPGFIDTPLTKKNPHSMPFLASAEDLAEAIYKGVLSKKESIYYPKFFSFLVRFLSILPRKIYKRIITRRSLNYSK